MASCCRTCDNRAYALSAPTTTRPDLHLILIILKFKFPLTSHNTRLDSALRSTLQRIINSAENDTQSTRFTAWSPTLDDPMTAIILTSANSTCASPDSPAFELLTSYLSQPPSCEHVHLDHSILNLTSTDPESRIPCDIIILRASNAIVATEVGKKFGWDPRRSSLAAQMDLSAPKFSKPGDLVRDFFGWTELDAHPLSPSSSTNSEGEPRLGTTNGDWMKGEWRDLGDETDSHGSVEEETLVMMFQWWTREDGERFKHPLQQSHGPGEVKVASDMWDRQIAHPVRQLEGIGAKVETFKVDLRGVSSADEEKSSRERSGSRRLSALASGMGEKMSFWK